MSEITQLIASLGSLLGTVVALLKWWEERQQRLKAIEGQQEAEKDKEAAVEAAAQMEGELIQAERLAGWSRRA